MNTHLLDRARRWLLTLALAVLLAVAAATAPMLLDNATGTSFTTAAFACPHPGGAGCG